MKFVQVYPRVVNIKAVNNFNSKGAKYRGYGHLPAHRAGSSALQLAGSSAHSAAYQCQRSSALMLAQEDL